jgi:hypothetical protein
MYHAEFDSVSEDSEAKKLAYMTLMDITMGSPESDSDCECDDGGCDDEDCQHEFEDEKCGSPTPQCTPNITGYFQPLEDSVSSLDLSHFPETDVLSTSMAELDMN